MRVEKSGTRYFGFEELASSMGIKPVSKVTKDKEKLAGQQERFVNRHKCRGCGQPMTWVGGNLMTCQNPNCKGIKFSKKNEETGEEKVWHETSYDLLDELGETIAGNIFSAEA